MNKMNSLDTRKLVFLALLTAIVVAFQLAAIVTRPLFPAFSISLVLMPIVIGAALVGVFAGVWLGLVFGVSVILSGDAAPFMAIDPFATIAIILLKGLLAGLAAGWVYKFLEDMSKTVASIIAAVVCPVVNTGIFVIGSLLFFFPTMEAWGAAAGHANAISFVVIVLAGVNFLVELGINLVLSPTIVRLIQYGQDKWNTAAADS